MAGTRPLKNFALPMILCNLSLEIEHLLNPDLVEQTIEACIHEVMDVFYDPALGLIRENVTPDGRVSDSFEGRLLNPGQAIEAMWFIMDLAVRRNDRTLLEKAVSITLETLDYAWDRKFGGILPAYGQPAVLGMVCPGPRLHLVALPRPNSRRMVRLPEPAGRGLAAAQGRQMERLLSRSPRVVPMLAGAGKPMIFYLLRLLVDKQNRGLIKIVVILKSSDYRRTVILSFL